MTDHSALVAAVQAKLELARAATPGPWVMYDGWDAVDGGLTFCRSISSREHGPALEAHANGIRAELVGTKATFEHIALNDPATVIRMCERDLRVLERHVPSDAFTERAICRTCRRPGYMSVQPWPCDEIRDLATAHGLETASDRSEPC